jgi:hypothetical protein
MACLLYLKKLINADKIGIYLLVYIIRDGGQIFIYAAQITLEHTWSGISSHGALS